MATGTQILPRLLKLPASERAELATQLIRSLDEGEDRDAAEAWLRELDKRANEVASGGVKLERWVKARKRIETRLRARQDLTLVIPDRSENAAQADPNKY